MKIKKKSFLLSLSLLILAGCGGANKYPTSINIAIDKPLIKVGETATLSWTFNPINSIDDVQIMVENPIVASVNGATVVGNEVGMTKIFVISTADKKNTAPPSGYVFIEVEKADVLPLSIAINSPTGSNLYLGNPIDLLISTNPNDASKDVEWKSSDESVATVDDKGRVEPLKEGSVVITASSKIVPTISGNIELSILPIPNKMVLDFSDLTNTGEFGTVTLGDNEATTLFKEKSGGIVNQVFNTHGVYSGNGGSGFPYSNVQGLIKFGAKVPGPGRLSFKTVIPVSRIEIVAADWGDQYLGEFHEGTLIEVNGVSKPAPYNQYEKTDKSGIVYTTTDADFCKGTLDYAFDVKTNEILIEGKYPTVGANEQARFRLFSISLYF